MFTKQKNLKTLTKILSLDISENNLSAVEIQFGKNNTVSLTNAFHLNVPVFQDANKTINYIIQNLKASNMKTKECVIGFSMQYFKLLPVPIPHTIPEEEYGSIIIQEGNLDPNNENIGWKLLKNTTRQDSDGITRQDVLGISIQKSLVDFSRLLCQKCNLKLISLSPSFLSIGQFLPQKPEDNLTATLWVSQIRSELVVWSGQEPIYEHLFLTHLLNDQIFQSINYIQTQLPGTQVNTVYSYGPFVKETNLSQIPYNIQLLNLPGNIMDATGILQKINLNEVIGAIATAASVTKTAENGLPNLLNSIKTKTEGLQGIFKDIKSPVSRTSLKEIKLPFASLLKSLDPELRKYAYASVLILLISIFSGLFIKSFLLSGLETDKSVFDNRITLAQAHLTKLLTFERTNKILNMKSSYFSKLIDSRKPWSRILKEIADMTPKNLWIDRLDIRNDSINIFGRSLNIDAVANFSINLNYTAKLLGNAQIIALKKFQEEGIDIVEFQVTVQTVDSLKTALGKEKDTTKSMPKT